MCSCVWKIKQKKRKETKRNETKKRDELECVVGGVKGREIRRTETVRTGCGVAVWRRRVDQYDIDR